MKSTTVTATNSADPTDHTSDNSPQRRRKFWRRRPRFSSLRRHTSETLSHSFNLHSEPSTPIQNHTLLNVNTATEEELMTLPGVDRQLAHRIVEHRRAIGRFRRVEDLALVRGIGADRLLRSFASEVCVNSRYYQKGAFNGPAHSTRTHSFDSLQQTSSDGASDTKCVALIPWKRPSLLKEVNVNTASVFEIQAIQGVTQEIAAAIVHYRQKKGPFKNIEDLIKVKHIDRARLNSLKRYLTICNESSPDTTSSTPLTNGLSHHSHAEINTTDCCLEFSEIDSCNHRNKQSKSGSITNDSHMINQNNVNNNSNTVINGMNGFCLTESSILDIFELLSLYSPPPIIDVIFNYQRNGMPAIRVASWNLDQFSLEKASNLGVREVICRTILENRWSIVAIQDIEDETTLTDICNELNKPILKRVSRWTQNAGNHFWNFVVLPSKLGFLYDGYITDGKEIKLNDNFQSIMEHSGNICTANFQIGRHLNLNSVNIKLKSCDKKTNLNCWLKSFEQYINADDFLIIFVDFSSVPHFFNESEGALYEEFNLTFPSTSQEKNALTAQHHPLRCSDILTNSKLLTKSTGFKGVITKGLRHLGIPNGWQWGGSVSPYSPIWTEIFITSHEEK